MPSLFTAVVIEEAFHLTAGQPHAVQRTADSGRVYAYWVCPDCGSCVTGAPRVAGAFRGVRAGSLDDTSWLRPAAHIWTRSKQPWVVLPDGDRQFETHPDDIAGFLGGAGPLPIADLTALMQVNTGTGTENLSAG